MFKVMLDEDTLCGFFHKLATKRLLLILIKEVSLRINKCLNSIIKANSFNHKTFIKNGLLQSVPNLPNNCYKQYRGKQVAFSKFRNLLNVNSINWLVKDETHTHLACKFVCRDFGLCKHCIPAYNCTHSPAHTTEIEWTCTLTHWQAKQSNTHTYTHAHTCIKLLDFCLYPQSTYQPCQPGASVLH